ncbi:ATP-binding cassette domain-containing protein [Luteitalea sp.]|uniref:peptidase domain-containing ABC transporter n=1 Tax=Luteitalea sp. TaxID=2004800 RepID=UPI0025B81528|nr:ATP-binding cassette domain-containing protein [Luteitalea sp.]
MSTSPASAPVPTVDANTLRTVVHYLADVHGVEVSPTALDATVRRLGHSRGMQSTIQALASEAGLITTAVRRPLSEVLTDADPAYPWVALRQGPDGQAEAIAVLAAARGGALVAVPGSQARAARWSIRSVVEWLGVTDADVPVEWIMTEPAAPLSPMRSRDGAPPLHPYARLRALLEAERRTLWVAVIYSVVIALLALVVPIAVQSLVNTIAFGSVLQPLVVLTLVVFVALGFSTVMNALRAGVVEIIQRSIFARVATDVTWRLLRVRVSAFDRYHGPELVNRFFDTITIQKSAALLLIDGLSILMQTVIGMVLLALYHPWLLAFDVLLVVAMGVIIFVLGRGALATSMNESKAKYALVAWLEQLAAHLVTFKSAGAADYAVERSHRLLEDYLAYRKKHFRILVRQIVGSFALQAVASSALLGIGGWLVINRQLTLGQLVASELIVAGMLSAFTKFGKQLEVFYDLCAAIDKLGVLVDLPLERMGGAAETASSSPMTVSLRDVQVKYDDGTRAALAIRSWDIPAGARVGVTGPNGAGKSTLADLMFGLREQVTGSIRIDGIDVRSLPLRSLRRDVALVRAVELFPGTVLENLQLGRDDLSYADVSRALEDVGLLEELLALPKGLDTELHPHGRPLSYRQACRLMVARAIVGRPRLIIIDGALDQIDRREDDQRLVSVLFADSAPWTLVCVTDRPDLLAACSRVVLLKDGEVRDAAREDFSR